MIPVGADELVALLTVRYAGREWHWSSRAVEVEDVTGLVRAFIGGLGDVELDDELELFGEGGLQSIAFEVYWPEPVAELVALGHDLGAATAEFALIREGDPWEDRLVILDGDVVDPEYGEWAEPVAFSIEKAAFEDGGVVPPASAVAKQGVTWADLPTESEGRAYPWVFGQPGPFRDVEGTVQSASASPAIYVDNNSSPRYVLIAGTRTEAGATGASVDIYNADLDETATLTALHIDDDAGRTVTVVDGTEGGALYFTRIADPWKGAHDLWTVWTGGSAAYCTHRDAPIGGAGDLLLALLEQSTMTLDRGPLVAAAEYLNRFRVSGYIDDGCSPYAWLRDNLMPLLPMSMAAGDAGIYPVVWRYDATNRDAIEALEVGPGLIRAGPITYEGRADVVNEVTLSYALRARLGVYARTRTITGDPALLGSVDTLSSLHARQSWSRYGRRSEALTTDIVYEADTADLILLTRVLGRGLTRRALSVVADERWSWLRRGDLVTITDESVSLSGQLAIVRSISRDIGPRRLGLLLLEDPVRDARWGQAGR